MKIIHKAKHPFYLDDFAPLRDQIKRLKKLHEQDISTIDSFISYIELLEEKVERQNFQLSAKRLRVK